MTIHLGTDHAGFELKEKVKLFLIEKGYEIVDHGALTLVPGDDYPDFIRPAAEAVAEDPMSRGIIFGGSGQGEALCANRIKGARAVVFYGPRAPIVAADATGRISDDSFEIVRLSRLHGDSNILSFGARFVTDDEAKKALEVWLEALFEGGRHQQRLDKIDR